MAQEVRGLGKIHMFFLWRSWPKPGYFPVMGFYHLCCIFLAFMPTLCCCKKVSILSLMHKLLQSLLEITFWNEVPKALYVCTRWRMWLWHINIVIRIHESRYEISKLESKMTPDPSKQHFKIICMAIEQFRLISTVTVILPDVLRLKRRKYS